MANTYKNAKVDLTTTNATTVLTTPVGSTNIIKSMLVSEDSGNADTITLTITDTDSAVFSLFKVKAVSANTTVELLTQPLVLQDSEILKATAATANRLHLVVSYLEISQDKGMGLSDILKKVVLPVAGSYFLGPLAGKGLSALGMTKAASSPLITNALASGLGSLAMGGKPKDALRSALIGGIGGTALQDKFPRASNVSTNATSGKVLTDAMSEGMTTGATTAPATVAAEPTTMSAKLLQGLGMKGDNTLFKLLNNPVGEGVAAGLIAQLLASMTDEEEDERTAFERRPFGFGGPGGQIGGLPITYAAMGGEMNFPRRDGGIDPSEGSGTKDDVPAMLTAGEFVLTKDAVKGLGDGNQRLGIQRAYDMMGDLEERA